MNLSKCRRCGKDVPVESRYATNKRFCSTDCYDTWWNEFRSKRVTLGELGTILFGPAPTVELNEAQKAWFAALIDGEGWIGIVREKRPRNKCGWNYKPAVAIVNSNLGLLEQAVKHADGYVCMKHNRHTNPKHKPVHEVRFNQRAIPAFLTQIKPYLVAKRQQAEVVLELCKVKAETPMRSAQNADIFESLRGECRALNRRGPAVVGG